VSGIRFGHATDTGHQRSNNQDNYSICPELGLWLVADGMGGHQSGELASAIIVYSIVRSVREGMSLEEALRTAHHQLVAMQDGETEGMGATVVAIQLKGSHYTIAWVGDSRAYLWHGALRQVTRDHSFIQEMLDAGAINEAEAVLHPGRSIVTQAIGAAGIDDVAVGVKQGQLDRHEQVLLCSDGLTSEVDGEQISRILAEDHTEQEKVDRLIETALHNGGSDNVTVLLLSAPDTAPEKRDTEVLNIDTDRLDSDTDRLDSRALGRRMWERKKRAFVYSLVGAALVIAIAVWALSEQHKPPLVQKQTGQITTEKHEPIVTEMTRLPDQSTPTANPQPTDTQKETDPGKGDNEYPEANKR